MTAVAQGYFLGRTLGEDSVCLFGEDRPGIRVLPPAAFLEAADRYDLVVNVDSLTEMAAETAAAYCGAIKARAGVFLSINHEGNPFTVQEVCAKVGMPLMSRAPYWLRRGYVEEVANCALTATKRLHMSVPSPAIVWTLARPPISTLPELSVTQRQAFADGRNLVERVQAAYRAAVRGYAASNSGWDVTVGEIKHPIHEALLSSSPEPATTLLRDPANNSHFWGFDAVCKAPEGEIEPHELVLRRLDDHADWKQSYARWLHDALISLAEAVGIHRTFYPETAPGFHYELFGEPANVDRILDGIETTVGAPIQFPNPYAGELGLCTGRRGIASFRAIQAIYQAWRLRQLSKGQSEFRVLEIGAGLGRTAYFAHQFGILDYTIVDIPLTNAAQGYFLGQTLGQDKIGLFGESYGQQTTRILPPGSIEDMTETFDVVLNVDSFTEMPIETMASYWRFARSNADSVLSINHELNAHRVCELYVGDPAVHFCRSPYWMRRGYVEEYITWKHRKPRHPVI